MSNLLDVCFGIVLSKQDEQTIFRKGPEIRANGGVKYTLHPERYDYWISDQQNFPFVIRVLVNLSNNKTEWNVTGKHAVVVWMSGESDSLDHAITDIKNEFEDRAKAYKWFVAL